MKFAPIVAAMKEGRTGHKAAAREERTGEKAAWAEELSGRPCTKKQNSKGKGELWRKHRKSYQEWKIGASRIWTIKREST